MGEHPEAQNILLRKQVGTLRERVKILQNSHSQLKEKSRITEKDTNDFVEYFQNEINFLNEKNLELQAQITMLLKEGKMYRENTETEHSEEILTLKKTSAAQIATLNARIQELEHEIKIIEEFKREKHNMVDEIESYKKSLLREQESRKLEIADQERRNVQTKNRMNHEFEERF